MGKWQTLHRQTPRAQRWDRHVAGASAAALRGDLGAILVDTFAVDGEAAEVGAQAQVLLVDGYKRLRPLSKPEQQTLQGMSLPHAQGARVHHRWADLE